MTFQETKRFLSAERSIVRYLRLLLDGADERLHRWEVLTRPAAAPVIEAAPVVEEISAPALKLSKPRGKRRITAAEFDLRYAR